VYLGVVPAVLIAACISVHGDDGREKKLAAARKRADDAKGETKGGLTQMMNLVVVHYSDGMLLKGETGNFFPNKNLFHLQERDSAEMRQINMQDLKAVYFVKSLDGKSGYTEKDDVERAGFGRKIRVHFKDGEVQYGYTQGYAPNRPGFLIFPCDPDSNNERIFVVTGATEEVHFI
jgi:hypothetical protein